MFKQTANKDIIENIEQIVLCINDDVNKYCERHNMDIYEFIDIFDWHE